MALYKKHGSRFWWYEFVFNGQRIQRSTKVENKREAENIEKAAWTQLARGEVKIEDKPKAQRVTVGELLDRLRIHYELHDKASVQTLSHLRRSKADFGGKLADVLTKEDIQDYQRRRQAKGAANGTVNRTLEVLRRAYSLGDLTAPPITKLPETNVRQGFFTREQFDKVNSSLPEGLRDFCLFAYLTGMRLGEIKSLCWSSVTDNAITLRGVDAKTGKPRTIVCAGELAPMLQRRKKARSMKTPGGRLLAAHIFHRNGEAIGEFRKSWSTACVAAGVGKFVCPKCKKEGTDRWCSDCKKDTRYRGKIFHDFRRTGVRNLTRSGVPRSVAMQISGHRTEAVFRRYDIVDEGDLAQAMTNLEKYHKAEKQNAASGSAMR